MALKFLFLATVAILFRESVQDKNVEQSTYQHHDTNHDGCLQRGEFTSIFTAMDTSPHDGKLSVREVVDGWDHFKFHDDRDATFFFMEMDYDRDTFITKNDLDTLYTTFDANNHDDCLTYPEFYAEWRSIFNE